jgi:hypothetical protein
MITTTQKTNGNVFTDTSGTKWLGFSFKRKKQGKRDIAIVYFQLLSAFNNLKLSDGEIKLLAHIALNKGIVSGSCKMSYVDKYESTIPSVDNTISKLKKKKLLLKKGTSVVLNPMISLDFTSQDNFIFSFKCIVETNTQTS